MARPSACGGDGVSPVAGGLATLCGCRTIAPVRALLSRGTIGRALVREAIPGILVATGATTFLLIVRSFFALADLLVSRRFSSDLVLKVLLLSLPHVLALTIPMGVLFAVLLTASRWASDSEFIALQAGGVPISRALRPLAWLAAVFCALDLFLTWQVLPRSNRGLQELKIKVAFSAARAAVQPRVFVEEFRGQVLFVDRIERDTAAWRGVLLFDQSKGTEERLVVADSGELLVDERDGATWLTLQDATTHTLKPGDPAAYQQNFNQELRMLLQAPSAGTARLTFGVRETASAELLRRARDAAAPPGDRESAAVELANRLAIPLACVVFALAGFPLGARNRRGGRGFAFTASVGMIVVYYVLLTNGEQLARAAGWPPAIGVWLPNALLAGIAVPLLRRTSSGYQTSPVSVGYLLSLPRLPWQRRNGKAGNGRGVAPAAAAPALRPAAGRRRFVVPTFLGIIDRHLVAQCISFFLLVVVSISAIYIAVNMSENVDEIQKHRVPFVVVASYYAYSLPQILHDILPLTFVIAFLGTAALIERHNESTALKAAGVSLTRVAAPLFALGGAIALGLFLLDESVVHRTNREAQRLEDVIKGRNVARSYRATDRLWLFLPDGRTLVNFLQFDPDTATLVRPSLYVFDERLNLRERYMANQATFEAGVWRAEGAWKRTFIAGGNPDYVPPHGGIRDLPIAADPTYFGREYRKPSQMSYAELRDYIASLKAAGYRVDRLDVQLHQKLAYPASLVVLAWLALPFAFRARRRGTVMGVAVALGLGIAYFAIMAVTTKLGEVGLLSPALGAWSPPVFFGLLAMNRHTTLRT
jgi:LPS export ABC transporter permease LptG/LPS export ABC transporter permease LptF